ncbi:MAG: DNA mismatch endonuclease Vsr [Alphaproteobacteria bacterium]|nr:DNA mismatch endonuclease Vsr [Alphaproteobacteria bacterium]
MPDTLTPAQRSANMAAIRSKDMKPEMAVRSLVHRMGYRFRLHRKDLPGKPDLVFASRKAVIFVHGCFWHQHSACREGRMPGTRLEYWKPKLERNIARDIQNQLALKSLGWRVLVLWECETGRDGELAVRIKKFLG